MNTNLQQQSHRSLSWYLVIVLSAVIVVVTGVVNWLCFDAELKHAEQLAQKKIDKTQRYLEGSLSYPAWNLDLEGIRVIVDITLCGEVEDTGFGIVQENRERIFIPFE